MQVERKQHWESVYSARGPSEVSWYQPRLRNSLSLMEKAAVTRDARILDVGGGLSTLADDLLAMGYHDITVLDLSAAALAAAQARLGAAAAAVTWVESDILNAELPLQYYDVWHDRAVFHFLTAPDDRRRYVETVRRSVRPGGHVIVATFGPEGPLQCSGLSTMRYDPKGLHREFGKGFELRDSLVEIHKTPGGKDQQFIYCHCICLGR